VYRDLFAQLAPDGADMSTLLAIDPGAKSGYAVFVQGANFWYVHNALVASPATSLWPEHDFDFVVIENPVIYPHSKARPADILKLSRIVGRYEERYGPRAKYGVHLVEPRQWKGTIDGDIMTRRIEANLSALDRLALTEILPGVRHNALDAIGLGFWALRQPWVKARV
jgi:hypothetical protein